MFTKLATLAATAVAVTALAAAPAFAAVTFDAATGTGFVGKGDVQTALTLNNAQLNAQAATLVFTYNALTEQETSWTCVNDRNEQTQERERTTSTAVTGVVSVVSRDNKRQITGFNLTGFTGTPTTTATTEGPKLESCPNANSNYVLGSTVVGDATVVSGGLFVNGISLG
jgi:hypothetical protein